MSNVTDLKKKWLKDPEFKAAYESMADEFSLASAVIEARAVDGLTQKELADRMDATQSQVLALSRVIRTPQLRRCCGWLKPRAHI